MTTVLEWLKQLDQQPPVCDWSLVPEVVDINNDDLFDELQRIKHKEGIGSGRWVVGLR